MSACPICNRDSYFDESVFYECDDPDGYSPIKFFDCPRCGIFQIDSQAAFYAAHLEERHAGDLAAWIREQNSDDVIPLIEESLIARLLFVNYN